MSRLGKTDELRRRYLQRLYERSGGDVNEGVNEDELLADLGIGEEEGDKLFSYLSSTGLVKGFTFGHIAITDRGIDEAERVMKSNFAEKERRVLQKLYDERERRHTNPHVPEELARDLKLDVDEVYDIINELEGQGLIGGTDEASWIIPPGIKLIESDGTRAGTASNVSFTTNIHGPNYGGIQQGGRGNTQNITLTNTNNSDLDRALASLVELIRSSQIPDDDKQELEEEVGKVNKLALREPTPGLLDRAKSRLDMIKLAVTGTDIAIKAAPHLDTLWELLKQRFGG